MDIGGSVESGFEGAREAFLSNFELHGEVGAAFCVIHEGRLVVDLWGGVAKPSDGSPWTRDTAISIASGGKALTATCAALLADRGELDVDAPVAEYWPEFAQAGKEAISLRWVLAHKAGVPAIDAALSIDDFRDWDPVIAALEVQPPLWEPGTAFGYHAGTFGFLVGEIVRRISGRRPAQFFREEISGPRELTVWILMDPSERWRLAEPVRSENPPPPAPPEDSVRARVGRTMAPLMAATQEQRLSIEMPSAGFATAAGLARFYAAVAGLGTEALIGPKTLEVFTQRESDGVDLNIDTAPVCWGLGYQLASPASPMLRSRSAFGHAGAGGSLGFADPEAGLAIGYVVNQLRPGLGGHDDPRSTALMDAVYAALNA